MKRTKKIVGMLLVMVMCISLCACGGDKKAFETSKLAYDNITTAYEITECYGTDIYEAWRLGIYHKEEVLNGGVGYLADELSLSEDEIRDGAACFFAEAKGTEWEELSDEDKDSYREIADGAFKAMEDNLFSFCVQVVAYAYKTNGKVNEAQTALDEAKTQMKELSEKYSDYEHYPNLKDYYTTTSSFLEFCQEPEGSFEQVQDTMKDYENEARDYVSDLDYIFEEVE